MKLIFPCASCMQNGDFLSVLTSNIEFRDDGRYEITCQRGHSSLYILQQQKFELLFDIGANAIVDGYYREAVSSFTSSLERFYEFFSKVICLSKNISWEEIEGSWKQVSSQSERQLGAFIFLHLLDSGSKPILISPNKIAFRNAVVHKGRIPSKEEALDYGQEILGIVRPLIAYLNKTHHESVLVSIFKHLDECRKPNDINVNISTMSIPTILSLNNGIPNDGGLSLKDSISVLIKNRSFLGS